MAAGKDLQAGRSDVRAVRPRDLGADAARGGREHGRWQVGREDAVHGCRRRRFEDAARAGADRAGLISARAQPGQVWGHHPAASRYQRRRVALMARMSASDHP